MSNLIRERDSFIKVEAFETQDMTPGEKRFPGNGPLGRVELPTCGGPSGRSQRGLCKEDVEEEAEERETLEDRLARVEREAYEKGFEQGRKDGLALEKRQMEDTGKRFSDLMSEIRDLKPRLYREAEKDLLQLSVLIAGKIIRTEVKTNPEIIGRTIRAAMQHIADKTHIHIQIHPEDMEEVRRILPELSALSKGGRFQVVEDPAVQRGGCALETGFGRINATLDDQLSMLEKEIEEEYSCTPGGHP